MIRFRGYRTGQTGGGCLVTVVDEAGDQVVLPLSPIIRGREVRHSPDGFQWGYSGSGPTELARAILVRLYPDDDRVRHPRCYRHFRDFAISRVKSDEFELKEDVARSWYEQWLASPEQQGDFKVERGWLES